MNKKSLLIFCFLCLWSFCYGIVLPDGTDARLSDISFSNEKIVSVVLSVPTELNTPLGKVEAVGTVKFFESGIIEEIVPNRNGFFDTPIGKLSFSEFEIIKFHESGALAALTLKESAMLTINDESFNIKPGYFFLYDEWKPFGFELAENKKIDFEFGKVTISRGSIVLFYSNGSILSFMLYEPTEIETASGKVIAEEYVSLWNPQTPMLLKVKNCEGLDTKYGKVYPVQDTTVSFSQEGIVTEVTPQDIMVCSFGDFSFMTQSKTTLNFSNEGNLKSGIIRNSKIKYKDWEITFYEENNKFIIYEENKLYLPYGLVSEINGFSFSKQTMRFLFTEDEYYSWTTEPLEYPGITNLCFVKKTNPTSSIVFKRIRDGSISHFNRENNEINIEDCPLLFNEEGKIIGYRKAAFGIETFNTYLDRWENETFYDSKKDEYVNYTEDVYFK